MDCNSSGDEVIRGNCDSSGNEAIIGMVLGDKVIKRSEKIKKLVEAKI